MTLPFVVLLLATFVGIAAFAVDFSRMFLIHGELQTAAEAGALAGANRLLNADGAHAADSAVAYARVNLTEKVAPDVTVGDVVFGHLSETFAPTGSWSDPNTNAVQVTTHHTGGYIFGPIYKYTSKTLHATAIAAIGSVTAAGCIRPIAMPYTDLLQTLYPVNTPPVTYELTPADVIRLGALTQANSILLKVGDPAATIEKGNFYAVREPAVLYADGTSGHPWTGGNDYRNALAQNCDALPEMVAVGDWLEAEQGNMVGPTKDGLATRCGITGNPNVFTCDPPVPFLVPIWDIASKSIAAPNAFHVKYLGVFKATGFSKGGATPDGISGYFSAMSVDGKYDTIPGPLTRAILRR